MNKTSPIPVSFLKDINHDPDNGIFIVVDNNNLFTVEKLFSVCLLRHYVNRIKNDPDEPEPQIIYKRDPDGTLFETIEVYPDCEMKEIYKSIVTERRANQVVELLTKTNSNFVYQGSCFEEL